MSEFQPCKLGELLRIEHGFAFKGEHFSDVGRHIVLTPGNFFEQGGFKPRPSKDRYYQSSYPPRYLLKKHALIVAMTEQGEGLLGSAAIVPDDDQYLHNQRIGLVRAKKGAAETNFLYYLFNTSSVRQQIRNSSAGTKIRHTSPERMYGVDVVVPDLVTQQKIAAILSTYDDLIANNQRRISLLERMAEDIYREWFVRLRFPGHENVKVEKGVPEGWSLSASNEAFDILGGGTPNTDEPMFWTGPIPFFTPKDATANFYALNCEKNISEKGLNACSTQLFPKNTIFITARGTVGKLALAAVPMAMNQSCYALRPKHAVAVYFHYLAIRDSINYIKSVSKSGVFDNIVMDTFKNVPLLLPPQVLMDRFNEAVASLFIQVANLLERNRLLASTRDSLLPRLISGKLSVDALDIRFPPGMGESGT